MHVYLGATITKDVTQKKEIARRIGMAKAKFYENKEFLRRNLSLGLKKKLLKCYVFTVFIYGSEAWNFNKELCRKIRESPIQRLKSVLEVPSYSVPYYRESCGMLAIS